MKIFTTLLALVISIGLPKAQTKNYREVILFAPINHEEIKKQLEYFKRDSTGLAERDIKVKIITSATTNQNWIDKMKLNKDDFTFILIGKDGGEKYRSATVVSTTKLFSIIDVMPMRMIEMKKVE